MPLHFSSLAVALNVDHSTAKVNDPRRCDQPLTMRIRGWYVRRVSEGAMKSGVPASGSMAAPGGAGAKVDRVVRELQELARQGALDMAFRIGNLIVDRFYGGDLNLWRRRGRKSVSLRALTRHPELPFSAAAIYRAVAIYELVERVGGVSAWKHLGPGHFRAVLALPEREQVRCLSVAEERALTVGQLEAQILTLKHWSSRGGRPRLPRYVKTLRKLRKLGEAPDVLRADPEELRALSPADRRELIVVAGGLARLLQDLATSLAVPLDDYSALESGDRESGVFPATAPAAFDAAAK